MLNFLVSSGRLIVNKALTAALASRISLIRAADVPLAADLSTEPEAIPMRSQLVFAGSVAAVIGFLVLLFGLLRRL